MRSKLKKKNKNQQLSLFAGSPKSGSTLNIFCENLICIFRTLNIKLFGRKLGRNLQNAKNQEV